MGTLLFIIFSLYLKYACLYIMALTEESICRRADIRGTSRYNLEGVDESCAIFSLSLHPSVYWVQTPPLIGLFYMFIYILSLIYPIV